MNNELKDGISAIIPTYKGEKYISTLLDSLINQTSDPELYEVIVIINGERDSTEDIIQKYKNEHPEFNFIITDSEKGVSNARNKGIGLVSRKYTIYIDDDDYISYNYFETLYKYVKPNRIVIGTYLDVDENTKEVRNSYLTPPLLENSGVIDNPYETMIDILVITTDKLIPTEFVKNSSFNPELTNGVDISYYANLYPVYDFEFFVVDKSEEANYYRLWREGSISRKTESYEFNIKDRLKVINDINKGLKKAKTPEMKSFIRRLTGGQVVKINNYLKNHPDEYTNVLSDILDYDYEFFPYKYLNTDISKLDNEKRELIISYAFSPTNTTTSNVVAKRILTEEKNVDVICASLDELEKDFTLEKIVSEFIINKYVVESNFSTEWNNIQNFVNNGLNQLGEYEKIYSRANFVHSHFLALEYKLNHPDTYWRAEFSDPLIFTLNKRHLSEKIGDEKYVERFNKLLEEENHELISIDNDINCICEYLTFLYADEIIFTNNSQKEEMIHTLPFKIDDIINKKAVISPHPTLDEKYYYIKKSNYEIDENYINFAYFGVIFSNRSFEDFINAFDNIDDDLKDKIRLHIFTPNITLFEQVLSEKLYKNTVINNNVDYLEFLNLTTKFDVLIVEDSFTKDSFEINPYLPSKISDYKGSKNKIWAICEKESEMSKLNIKYKSYINNLMSNIDTLNAILSDCLNNDVKSESDSDESEYYRQRINHLTQKINELIDVAQVEFKKDEEYEAQINELTKKIQNLEKENSKILNSNSWKFTKNFRKIGKKFK